jgi:2,4-dienoyl-CoA reductase-like NADH-dependent reductase (Old Yellow Enzyme family)
MSSLRQLFTPISIGTMEVKNRIVMAPMATDYAASDGSVSQRLIDYLAARAEGGVGLITCEMTTIDELSPYVLRTLALWDDKFIPGFKRLSDAVHAHGAKIIPQIAHPGPESLSPFLHQRQPVGPSPVMCFVTKHVSRELEHDEIETIIEQFGSGRPRGAPEKPAATAWSCTPRTPTCWWDPSSRRCATSVRTSTAAISMGGSACPFG